MIPLRTTNIGSYPRIGENKDQQRLRRAAHHLQNKDISAHAFNDVEQSVIQELVREQITAGMDEVTDGLVSWPDPISHFARYVTSLKLNGLARFFDTNSYYRVPVFSGKPRRQDAHVLEQFKFARGVSFKPIRSVLTGPYTLATHSQARVPAFKTLKARLTFFTSLIKWEVSQLAQNGAPFIQIDEPAIAKQPDDIPLFLKTIEVLAGVAKPAKFSVAFYFAPLAPLYDHLRALPVDTLHFDFTYDGKKLYEKMVQNPPKAAVGFGLINGRNTKMDVIDPIIHMVKPWLEKSVSGPCYLTPSCGLEHLPRDVAFAKLKLIKKIKDEIQPELNPEGTHA